MRLSTTRRAWQVWQAAAGTWQGWSVCPALLAPEVEQIVPRSPARHIAATALAIAEQLSSILAPQTPPTLIHVDLEPTVGVIVAAQLNVLHTAQPLLVLPRWPYVHGILAVDTLVPTLVREARHLHQMTLEHVCLVTDGPRERAVPDRASGDRRADNRYRLLVHELPNLAALRARGISRILQLKQL